MSISSVARKYGIHPNQSFQWRRLMQDGALCALKAGEGVIPLSEAKKPQNRIRELERILGRKTLENEILEEAVRIARE